MLGTTFNFLQDMYENFRIVVIPFLYSSNFTFLHYPFLHQMLTPAEAIVPMRIVKSIVLLDKVFFTYHIAYTKHHHPNKTPLDVFWKQIFPPLHEHI